MERKYWRGIGAFAIFLSLPVFTRISSAQTACPDGLEPIAIVNSVQGTLTLNTRPLAVNDPVCPGQVVLVTAANSRASIRIIATGIKVRLDQNTELHMDSSVSVESIDKRPVTDREDKSLVELVRGAIHVFTRAPKKLDVRTPYVTAGVEGTEFLVEAFEAEKEIYVHVFEGLVRMLYQRNSTSSDLDVLANEAGYAKEDQPPRKVEQARIKSRDQVEWALYYPPLSGKPEIEAASELIAAGRVEEAEKVLEGSESNDQTLALMTIIKVAQGKSTEVINDEALVDDLKKTALSRLALSYAYQASLQLDDALAVLEEIVEKDALIWARIAELLLSHSDIKGAAEAAAQAPIGFEIEDCGTQPPESPPDFIARTLTVRGFSQLAQMNTDKAMKEFECAVLFASEDPLPRFGLGLTKIRRNQLAEGRHDIEIAALLDPTNSLIRSYLGKAFYEEGRKLSLSGNESGKLADRQLVIAKELDPNDPTPWFYHAIKKQTENEPVNALQDLHQAINKNDNRAVYRSEFLLDQDLAARSSGLARIYSDLGFDNLALVDGWKSVNLDPGNHSAHRFLADSYASLPGHEIARLSELLQSQLRQPLNATPIQPQLAEADLFILEGAGPSDTSFNEFNPLYMRNGISMQLNGIYGGNNTNGFDTTGSAIFDRAAASIGFFRYDTDGFRLNNDNKQEVANVFFQYQPFHHTSVQAEVRLRNIEQGDLSLFFYQDMFSRTLRTETDTRTYRVGLYHEFNRHNNVLFNISKTEDRTDVLSIGQTSINSDREGFSAEGQYLFQTERFILDAGVGFVEFDSNQQINFLSFPIPPIRNVNVVRHLNGYLYSTLIPGNNWNFTLGVGIDKLRGSIVERTKVNPKAGITWTINESTEFRASAFKALNRTLVGSQTLERTQLAGFNQYFNDGESTQSWRYGLALDHKISKTMFLGMEYSRLGRTTPILNATPVGPPVIEESSREDLFRSYLYWTPTETLALRTGINGDFIEKDVLLVARGKFSELDTYRLELGANYFHPGGFRAGLTILGIKQQGVLINNFSVLGADEDTFSIVEVEAAYRLPNRLGRISLVTKNLFNSDFKFQDIDPERPSVSPERLVLLQASLFFR